MKTAGLLLFAGVLCAQPQLCSIAGVAVDSVSGKPLKRLTVALSSTANRGYRMASYVTGEDGRFAFEVLPGTYSLVAERSGLPPQVYGAKSLLTGFGVAIIAAPGQKTDDLTFRVHAPAAISGRIIDDAGEPVENALVQLVVSFVANGQRRTRLGGSVYSNDVGEYRFGGIPAGTYYLAVTGAPWYAKRPWMARGAGGPPTVTFAPVYYPNVDEGGAAAPLTVLPGQEVTANFSLRPVPGFNLSIQLASKNVQVNSRVLVRLSSEGVPGSELYARVISSWVGGTAQIPAVPPGRYLIRVTARDGGAILASKAIEVSSGDVDTAVGLDDAIAVSGKVATEEADGGIPAGAMLVLRDEQTWIAFSRPVGKDGSFQFPRVAPGSYRAYLAGANGMWVKAVSLEEGPIKDGLIEIGTAGLQNLTVMASTQCGRVKGVVERDGRALAGMLVVLAPEGGSNDAARYLGFQTDSDGSFVFKDVPVGDYRILVTEDIEFEYMNPKVAGPALRKARLVRVEAGKEYEERF